MLSDAVFSIQTPIEFNEVALRVFNYQYINNPIYQRFCNLLGITKTSVKHASEIPFLPIEFFKKAKIISSSNQIQKVFSSSGTTGSITSKHYITDLTIYETSFNKAFHQFYGDPSEYVILALLPSYLEREGSSLVYMAEKLIKSSNQPESGFYLHNLDQLAILLNDLKNKKKKTLLIGVSFALLDLIENHSISLDDNFIVMETGGMKGKRKELTRFELHDILTKGFNVPYIHSEYGMTELLSQAYSTGNGLFQCPPWMQISTRDPEDPFSKINAAKTGGINIIDLANINSCSFIATQDLGRVYKNDVFEIIGRFDHSDIRGCNLMAL